MDTNLLTTELLNEYFPTECETAGPTNLEDIVTAETEFASSQYGSNMDLSSAIQVLVIASTFIKTAVDLYISVKNQTGRDLEEVELLVGIVTKKEIFKKLDKNTQQQLTRAIARKLKSRT